MSLMDKSRNSSTVEQQKDSNPLQAAEFVNELSPIEQLPFPDCTVPLPGDVSQLSQNPQTKNSLTPSPTTRQLPGYTPPPSFFPTATRILPEVTRALPEVTRTLPEVTRTLPEVTRVLPDPQTGALPLLKSNTTTLRQPVVIRPTGKKSSGMIRPPQGRRLVVHASVAIVLAFVVLSTLLAVAPTGGAGRSSSPFSPITRYFSSSSNNTTLLAQQAATVTAVTQDGFDPGSNKTYAGLPTAPPSSVNVGGSNSGSTITNSGGNGTSNSGNGTNSGSGTSNGSGNANDSGGLNRFFYGQCTYWANMRYHALTGHWVSWTGNADAWAYGAGQNGWVVSSMPHVPSIIVLQPEVQGAGPFGHVAVVESINPDGSVSTSNWNWAGGWATLSYVTFRPGPGVSFVWYP